MRKKKSAKKYNIEVQIDKIFNELFKSEVKESQLKKIEPNHFISDFKSQAEQIICPICLLIPLNPIQCKKCDNIVCEECMNKNSKCAICRDIFEKKLDKCLFRMIEKMKLNCPLSTNTTKKMLFNIFSKIFKKNYQYFPMYFSALMKPQMYVLIVKIIMAQKDKHFLYVIIMVFSIVL